LVEKYSLANLHLKAN